MLERTNADEFIKTGIGKGQGLSDTLHVVDPGVRMELRRIRQGLLARLQPRDVRAMPGKAGRPEAIAAADVEQPVVRLQIEHLPKQGILAIPIERQDTPRILTNSNHHLALARSFPPFNPVLFCFDAVSARAAV